VEQLEDRCLLSTTILSPSLTGDAAANPAGIVNPIQHIFYVVKENRTFDQVFGSLGKGNGDPSLDLFGEESAPNQRALQRTFVTLDNFYADSEVSADGWNWLAGALANTYVQKAYPQDYSNGYRGRGYDFEGGNFATSPGPNPQDAFIWDKLSDAGISYRNYGFRVFRGQVASTEPRLAANTDLNFQGFDLSKPDSDPTLLGPAQPTRIAEWLKEFNNYVATGTLPTVEFVRLPNDHNAGTFPGAPTPRAYMADNDYALGQLVDAVSHSPYWSSSVIFVTEDDSQDGPDHVDAHRNIGQVISPYTQTGMVDSTFYSTVSMLRSIELLVGIPPMTQFDAAATPFIDALTNHPDFTPYTAVKPTQNFDEKNPAPNPLGSATEMAQLQTGLFTTEDLTNAQVLNQQIWESIKGNIPMPDPVIGFRGASFNHPIGETDNLHAGPQGDGTGITTQGWDLTPIGQQVQLGDRPMGIAISPDGKTILVSNDGASAIESLMVIDRATGDVLQTINYPAPEALWIGLAFSPDGTHAYASAGGNNKIRVYNVDGQTLTETTPIVLPLPIGKNGKPISLYPAGLSVSPDGSKLYVADNLGDRMSVIDLATNAVTTIPVGHDPYTTIASKDGKTVYVSNWGDTTVSVVDVSGATPVVTQTIDVGTHPNVMLLNPANNELYVANADSDTISVLDTTTNQVVRTIDLAPFPKSPVGASPDGLAISSDGSFLFVANATDNDVAIILLARDGRPDHVQGLIPTGWIPSGVVLSPDNLQLAVINSKGLGAGPNLQGPNPYLDPESTDQQYVGSMIVGSLSLIDTPDVALHLKQYTNQVFQNDRFFALMNGSGDEVIKLGVGTGGAAAASDAAFARGGNLLNSELPELGNAFLLSARPVRNGPSEANAASSAVKPKELASSDALIASPGASRVETDLGAGVVEEAPDGKLDDFQVFPDRASIPSCEVVARLDEGSMAGNETRPENDATDF
jgi:YVTN family beta-propeller protein